MLSIKYDRSAYCCYVRGGRGESAQRIKLADQEKVITGSLILEECKLFQVFHDVCLYSIPEFGYAIYTSFMSILFY